MGFIERLRQEKADEDARNALIEQGLKAQKEAYERSELEKWKVDRDNRERRRLMAVDFRKESGVSPLMDGLADFFGKQFTIPYSRTEIDPDGQTYQVNYFESRGRRVSEKEFKYKTPKDPDSVFDTVCWDTRNYIAVESCPDGTIVFHGGWLGSTTIPVIEWRIPEKDQVFDKALERAYHNPAKGSFTVKQTTGL